MNPRNKPRNVCSPIFVALLVSCKITCNHNINILYCRAILQYSIFYRKDFIANQEKTRQVIYRNIYWNISLLGAAIIALTFKPERRRERREYCTVDFTGKPWKYVLIPHNGVMLNMSFDVLAKQNEYKCS